MYSLVQHATPDGLSPPRYALLRTLRSLSLYTSANNIAASRFILPVYASTYTDDNALDWASSLLGAGVAQKQLRSVTSNRQGCFAELGQTEILPTQILERIRRVESLLPCLCTSRWRIPTFVVHSTFLELHRNRTHQGQATKLECDFREVAVSSP